MRMLTQKSFEEMRSRANEVIQRVNLINANKKLPSEISGGMQKSRHRSGHSDESQISFCDEPNSVWIQKHQH